MGADTFHDVLDYNDEKKERVMRPAHKQTCYRMSPDKKRLPSPFRTSPTFRGTNYLVLVWDDIRRYVHVTRAEDTHRRSLVVRIAVRAM